MLRFVVYAALICIAYKINVNPVDHHDYSDNDYQEVDENTVDLKEGKDYQVIK